MARFDSAKARVWTAGALLVAVTLSGWVEDPRIRVSGRVDVQDLTLQAPRLAAPAINPDAGFAPATLASGTSLSVAAPQPARTPPYPPVAVVSAVMVRGGDHVKAGQVLARWEARTLDAQAAAARTDVEVARSRVGVLQANLDDLDDKESDLKAKRDDLATAIDTLSGKRRELVRTAADLRDKRNQASAAIAKLQTQRATVAEGVRTLTAKRNQVDDTIATLIAQRATVARQLDRLRQAQQAEIATPAPGATPTPGPRPRPPEIDRESQINQLEQALVGLDSGLSKAQQGRAQLVHPLSQATEGLAKIDTGLTQASEGKTKITEALAKLDQGLGQLDTNLAKARDGMSQIEDGLTKIRDARVQVRNARTMAELAIGQADVGVRRADDDRTKAILLAPEDGTVLRLANLGETFAPGATVAVLRPDRPTRVRTWLAPEQVAQLCPGDGVQVSGDAAAMSAHGNVIRIGERADYPPTAQATDQVHLTRAIEVTIAVDGALPPGVPVDLSINPCQQRRQSVTTG